VYRFLTPTGGHIDSYETDSPVKRALAARWLRGRGLEFGALHQPLAIDASRATVVYADRWSRGEAIDLFPELRSEFDADLTAAIVDPVYRIDLDTHDLSSVESEQFDFFVANDVMEHLANPIRFLKSVSDVMTPGSRLFLSVPDRHFTHDANRGSTTRRHLWREYRREVTTVDDRHVVDDLVAGNKPIPSSERERKAYFDEWRRRSFHVHVWDDESFSRLLRQANRRLSLHLDVLEHAGPRQTGGGSVWVLERR
jgi:SAM-dependent methyltransferase